MNADTDTAAARRPDAPDSGYAWLHDGNMPHTREDLIAEAVAFVALLFSLAIGILIAVLPVSARAATATAAARGVEPPGYGAPYRPAGPATPQRAAATPPARGERRMDAGARR